MRMTRDERERKFHSAQYSSNLDRVWDFILELMVDLNAADSDIAQAQKAAALASRSQDGETPREGENWWDEAANDVMRHAKASNPPDWKNAITGGLLRAFNRGRAAKDLQQR